MIRCFLCLLLLSSISSGAQLSLYDSVNIKHDRLTTNATYALAGWSLASVTSGLIGKNNSSGEAREFHKRNVLFGSINLGLAGLGILRNRLDANRGYPPEQTFKRTAATQRLFLFNAGLDLAYIAYGLYTRERAYRYTGARYDKLRGTGNALLAQGGFLTVFDFVQYLLHSSNAKRLNTKLQTLSFTTTADGLGLVYRF